MNCKPGFSRIVILTALLLIISDCQKYDQYREQYLGSWTFKVSLFQNMYGVQTRDTVSYLGNINKDLGDNELRITYMEGKYFIVSVEKDGKILNRCTGVPHRCEGEFIGSDTLHYYYLEGSYGSYKRETSLYGTKIH